MKVGHIFGQFIMVTVIYVPFIFATPNAPSNIGFDNITSSSVNVCWGYEIKDMTGFKIYRKIIGEDWSSIPMAVVDANTICFPDSGLSPNTTYDYMVKATDDTTLPVPLYTVPVDKNIGMQFHRTPFVVKSTVNGTNLLLLATRHSRDLQSPTHKSVKYIIDNIDTDTYVILEGFLSSENINNINLGPEENSEQQYAHKLAKAKGIALGGGEPTDLEEYTYLRDEWGYTLKDFVGLWTLKYIGGGSISENEFITIFDRTKDQFNRTIFNNEQSIDFSYVDFKNWYENRIGESFDNTNIMQVWPDGDSNYIRRMDLKLNVIRDNNLNTMIHSKVGHYSNVLVVYGGNHITDDDNYKRFSSGATGAILLKKLY